MQKVKTNDAIQLYNSFVESLPAASPFSFNPSLFNFYKKHFNWQPYYILLTRRNEVCAVLPLVYTGKAWTSLPHFSYGGMLLNDNCCEELTSIIINGIIQEIITTKLETGFYIYNINKKLTNNNVSVNTFIRTLSRNNDTNFVNTSKVTSIIKLPESENILYNGLNSNLKRKINKAKKSEINIKSGGVELLDDFYRIYSRNIFNLKSLNYGKKFIADLISSYQYGDIRIFVAYINNSPIASSLLASYGGFYENMFFATKLESRKFYISDLLHWEMTKYSINNNNLSKNKDNVVYSFGRSTINSGVHKYKSHWPITDYPIYHYSNTPDIKTQRWLQTVWGKIPYFISSPLGTKLIKHIY